MAEEEDHIGPWDGSEPLIRWEEDRDRVSQYIDGVLDKANVWYKNKTGKLSQAREQGIIDTLLALRLRLVGPAKQETLGEDDERTLS